MSMLVILLAPPPRADLAPQAGPAALDWLLSRDGRALERQGCSAPAQMPRADSIVAVVPAGAIAWHRPIAPRAPAARLRAALGGVLEEQLLTDDADTHLALAPRVMAGAPVWVAALHKPWLAGQLAALGAAGLVADRLVPLLAPVLAADGSTLAVDAAPAAAGPGEASAAPAAADGGPSAHFFTLADASGPETPWLAWADTDGALCLPLHGALARTLLPRWRSRSTQFSATPAAAAQAERWLGQPVAVRSEAEQALAALRSRWNLLQFDLAPKRRSSLALGRLGQRLRGAEWRAARLGLAALAAVQLLGLNAMAWQQEHALTAQRAEMDALLRSSHPQVRAVLDAPLQMRRETAALRTAAGVPGEDDFEPLLAAVDGAWPDGLPPAGSLRFESGRLTLPAGGLAPPQIDQLRARLRPTGWALDSAEGRLVIRRAETADRSGSATAAADRPDARPVPRLAALDSPAARR